MAKLGDPWYRLPRHDLEPPTRSRSPGYGPSGNRRTDGHACAGGRRDL